MLRPERRTVACRSATPSPTFVWGLYRLELRQPGPVDCGFLDSQAASGRAAPRRAVRLYVTCMRSKIQNGNGHTKIKIVWPFPLSGQTTFSDSDLGGPLEQALRGVQDGWAVACGVRRVFDGRRWATSLNPTAVWVSTVVCGVGRCFATLGWECNTVPHPRSCAGDSDARPVTDRTTDPMAMQRLLLTPTRTRERKRSH